MNHTPGPWNFEVGDFNGVPRDGALGSIVSGADDIYLAEVWNDYEAEDASDEALGLPAQGTAVANARLIAAAPDLFAALTMVRDADDECRRDALVTIPDHARALIDAAIAKAEGKDQL